MDAKGCGVVEVKVGAYDEHPEIGGYKRAMLIWGEHTPELSVITFFDSEPVSALRTFTLTLGQPAKVRRVSGVSIQERQQPISAIGIGALGTKKGFEGKGFMTAAIEFLTREYQLHTNALVAMTKRPGGGLWKKNGFVATKSPGINGNQLVAKVFNVRFDPEIAWKVPFHF